MTHTKRVDKLNLRIYDFSRDYEVKGFQEHLNIEARDYLKTRGIESTIMPAPQGAGAGVMESASLILKILSLLIKIFPFISRYVLAVHETHVDEAMRHFTIWLDVTNSKELTEAHHLSKRILMIGYDLKLQMEKTYPNYIFKVQTSVECCSDESTLQLHVNKLHPKKSDIGRLLRSMDKHVTGKHYVEYVTLSDNSKVRYSFYDR